MDRKIKRKMKKYHWLIILGITTLITMYVYGMTNIYLPTPLHIGFGQYLDLSIGIIIIVLLSTGFIIGIIFKKKDKKVK